MIADPATERCRDTDADVDMSGMDSTLGGIVRCGTVHEEKP
jgi:hypothetical protein